ncbi:oxidoreductase [Neobacillus cucumis]|uniref:oxidoreductase n=1 Tax=Neobacillus cucumis TaxID=1740721 RepID=UPI0020424575|nr:oxidoreductase [Neobacillus cucumis]MCM3724260.1 oxidoreductase [Neobacillus cucumis]
MSKVWFITGATRGMGVEIAKAALAARNKVVATGRKAEDVTKSLGTSDNLFVTALDITREDQVKDAVQDAIEHFGRIDVLVNNAGYGHLGVFEESSMEEIRAQYNTNVFGTMAVTQAVIPGMRKQRSGRIINISSVAGLKGVFGGSIYNSSKFAVEGFTQAIAEELALFGVYVTAVSPGFFRTDFLDSSSVKYSNDSISDYSDALETFRKFHDDRNHTQAGDPVKLAEVILHLAKVENPPVSFIAGSDGIEWAESVIKSKQEEIDAWRNLSVSTDGNW